MRNVQVPSWVHPFLDPDKKLLGQVNRAYWQQHGRLGGLLVNCRMLLRGAARDHAERGVQLELTRIRAEYEEWRLANDFGPIPTSKSEREWEALAKDTFK